MPTGSIARMLGSVTGGYSPPMLSGQVDGAAYDELTGTVSRALIESWEAPALFFRYRVKLAGEWLTETDLHGALSIDRKDLDSHTSAASFGLRGVQWSAWRTTRTWALTPVEVYIDHGVAGSVVEPTVPDWFGYVIGCDQGSDHEPIVTVRCGGPSTLYERYDACEEFAPLTGLTRGQMLDVLFSAAGASINSPAGAVYDKPLQAINKKLFQVVVPFIEPEGWRLRETVTGGFETYQPELKRAPLAPDWTWTKGDVVSMSAIPPESVPSRWVATGSTVLITDELGVTRELTVNELVAEYAPVVALLVRQSDGTTIASGYAALPEVTRVISRIQDEVLKRGQEVIQQRTTEYGYYNPRRARLRSNGTSGGTPGLGFDYVTGFVDPEGEDVQWHMEKFVPIGERVTDYSRDVSGTLLSQRVRTTRYGRRLRAVRTATTATTATTHADSWVFSDDQSYADKHEVYGLFEEQRIAFTYAAVTGPLSETTQDTYQWHAAKAAIDDGSYEQLYDGTGQTEVSTVFELTERKVMSDFVGNGQVKGERTVTYGWSAAHRVGGAHDWGEFESDAPEETFKFIKAETKQFNALSEEQLEEVEYPAEGGRKARRILGRQPITLYTGSTWTRVVSEPFEVVIDDPTVEAWFGFARETITSEYILNATEALRVINMRRRRMLARKLVITRPDSPAQKGDTVYFTAPEDGINARFIIADKSMSLDMASPMPMASYRLEEWVS